MSLENNKTIIPENYILIHYPNGVDRFYDRRWFCWELGKKYFSTYIDADIIVAEILEDRSEVWFDWAN